MEPKLAKLLDLAGHPNTPDKEALSAIRRAFFQLSSRGLSFQTLDREQPTLLVPKYRPYQDYDSLYRELEEAKTRMANMQSRSPRVPDFPWEQKPDELTRVNQMVFEDCLDFQEIDEWAVKIWQAPKGKGSPTSNLVTNLRVPFPDDKKWRKENKFFVKRDDSPLCWQEMKMIGTQHFVSQWAKRAVRHASPAAIYSDLVSNKNLIPNWREKDLNTYISPEERRIVRERYHNINGRLPLPSHKDDIRAIVEAAGQVGEPEINIKGIYGLGSNNRLGELLDTGELLRYAGNIISYKYYALYPNSPQYGKAKEHYYSNMTEKRGR